MCVYGKLSLQLYVQVNLRKKFRAIVELAVQDVVDMCVGTALRGTWRVAMRTNDNSWGLGGDLQY